MVSLDIAQAADAERWAAEIIGRLDVMKVLLVYAFSFLVITSGCQPAPDIQSEATNTMKPVITPTWEEVYIGEPVKFNVKETFPLFCTNQDQFSIIQILDNGYRRVLKLEHSCFGIVGSGVDEYCENGKIVRNYQGNCSDAISCIENYSVNYEFNWDQQEYVMVTEDCEGKTIRRESRQQVPAGEYQVIVNNKVIKEFVIVQNDHKP